MKPVSPPPASLAGYLLAAVRQRPDAPALSYSERTWSFAGWLGEVAAAPAAAPGTAYAVAGDALALAAGAYRASLQNRPFIPVDRNRPPPDTALPPEVALAIATSGSEGAPRLVLLGNRQLAAAAANANTCMPLYPGDSWLNCLPLYHIGGQAILWRCAQAGATVRLHDGFDTAAVAADLALHPVSHISLVPAMLARLLEAGVRPPAGLRVALIGGAALSRPLYERAVAAGWPLFPSYGMSETAALIATWTPADGPWHEGLVGRPLPGHEARIAGDGRIQLRGPQVMLGTLSGERPAADGWLTTGDLGRLDAAGRLTVLGRADDLLISGGRNIHPVEVESCLAACPGVADVAVTGLPDPVWGDLVVALIVGPADPAELLAHARRHLPAAALPRRIRRLPQLPRNAAGKLERAALRRLAAEAEA